MPRATPQARDAKTVPAKPSEASLLSQAQRALKSSPERALALTKRHKQLYPNGALAQEREVIAIEALARLDKKGTAAQKASEFGDKYPDSAHQKKVDSALEK
jgi:outer membrane protein assembly factor BamD (BamD/ComL family)